MNMPQLQLPNSLRASLLLFASSLATITSTNFFIPVNALGIATPLSNHSFAPAYVAIGDSLTTGSSVATCQDNRRTSPWGCQENPTAAVPYPDRVAQALRLTYSDDPQDYRSGRARNQLGLYRAGIWGYTVQEAANAVQTGHNQLGTWLPQLEAVTKARQLVTGALGINDMQFSNVAKWARLYIKPGGDHITAEAQSIIASHQKDFSVLFDALYTAKANNATAIVTLYYNPYDTNRSQCNGLKDIGERIVNSLDDELTNRAHQAGIYVADFRQRFAGHGAGSEEPYVFGTNCSVDAVLRTWALSLVHGTDAKQAIGVAFDPHPNNSGTQAMANTILQEYNNAD